MANVSTKTSEQNMENQQNTWRNLFRPSTNLETSDPIVPFTTLKIISPSLESRIKLNRAMASTLVKRLSKRCNRKANKEWNSRSRINWLALIFEKQQLNLNEHWFMIFTDPIFEFLPFWFTLFILCIYFVL